MPGGDEAQVGGVGGNVSGGMTAAGAPIGGSAAGSTPIAGNPAGGTVGGGGSNAAGSPVGKSGSGGGGRANGGTGGSPEGGGAGEGGEGPDQCGGYLELWKTRQSVLPPGATEPPPGSDPTCFECFMTAGCQRPQGDCSPGGNCLNRHCFCTPKHTVPPTQCLEPDYPDNLCDCLDSCFPAQPSCVAGWRTYMRCIEATCTAQCS
jgi:hypothetical protein